MTVVKAYTSVLNADKHNQGLWSRQTRQSSLSGTKIILALRHLRREVWCPIFILIITSVIRVTKSTGVGKRMAS